MKKLLITLFALFLSVTIFAQERLINYKNYKHVFKSDTTDTIIVNNYHNYYYQDSYNQWDNYYPYWYYDDWYYSHW